jgi:hypothetical protein
MARRWWTPDEDARAVAMRRAGAGIAVIARKLRRTPDSVKCRLCRHLNAAVMVFRPWTTGEVLRAVELRRGGLKIDAIARRLDRPRHSVRAKLERLRVLREPHKAGGRRPGQLSAPVGRLLRDGWSVSDVAEKFGVDPSCVSRIRARLGIPAAARADVSRRAWAWRDRGQTRTTDHGQSGSSSASSCAASDASAAVA